MKSLRKESFWGQRYYQPAVCNEQRKKKTGKKRTQGQDETGWDGMGQHGTFVVLKTNLRLKRMQHTKTFHLIPTQVPRAH